MKNWLELKSGSDVRGTALPGVPGEEVNLTREDVRAIAGVFSDWLSRRAGKPVSGLKISIGMDSRLSSPDLLRAVAEGMAARGAKVLDCGLCSTPAMFMTTLPDTLGCDGAVMVTASHLPWNRNGLKFFTPRGGLEGAEIKELLTQVESAGKNLTDEYDIRGTIENKPFLGVYAEGLAQAVRRATGEEKPLSGLRIVLDAGNGVGGFFVDGVLKPLGADTSGSLFLEPDGRFPNHIPNPENPEAMEAIGAAVKRAGADLGVIFDTDCDRAAVVGADGSEINRNRLVALASAMALEKYPGGTVVTDSITSTGLAEFIRGLGGVHRRFKRGYRNVIDEAIRLEKQGVLAPLAIETSGHCAFKDNYFLDDGAYLVTRVLVKMAELNRRGKKITDLIAGLREPAEATELRFKIAAPDFKALGQAVLNKVEKAAESVPGWAKEAEGFEGVRVNSEAGRGWFLLRMSLHDPVMPLNIESDAPGGSRAIAREIAPLLQGVEGLDTTALDNFIGQGR
jgi:phosphomannomutase